MTKRRLIWLFVFLFVAAAITMLVPASPVFLGRFIVGDNRSYDNHSVRYWVKTLNSSTPSERYHATFALGAIGSEAGEAVPAIAHVMVDDPDRDVRNGAALALLKMIPASRAAVPELARALRDSFHHVRMNAAITLFRLGEDARPAVPDLLKALEDEENQTNLNRHFLTIQQFVILALGRASAGDSVAVPALVAILKNSPTGAMRIVTTRALGDIGAPATPAIPELESLLSDEIPDVQEAAKQSLRKIRGEAAPTAEKSVGLAQPHD